MKIKSIYIDGLHNAVATTYNFTNLVYLFGRNGAGKTTILNGIQLALLGYIPGTAKNSREAILRHSKSGTMTVRLVLDDNGSPITIERKFDSKATKLTIDPETFDIQSITSEIELPIFNFNDFIDQTANKLKDYFIQNILPTTDGELNWRDILSNGLLNITVEDKAAVVDYGMDLISKVSGSPLEQVTQANSLFKEEQSFNKAELARLQATIDSLIYYGDYTGTKDVSELNAKLLSLGAIRDALIRYNSAEAMLAQHNTEITRLKERCEDLGGFEIMAKLAEVQKGCQEELNNCTGQISKLEQDLRELNAIKHNLDNIISGNGICPYTQDPCQSIDLNEIKVKSNANDLLIDARMGELQTMKDHEQNLNKRIDNNDNVIATLTGIKERLAFLEQSMSALPEKPDTTMSLTELDQEIQRCTDDKTKLQANQVYEDTIENITKLKYQAELNNSALSAWVKLTDINGLQTSLTEKPFEELAVKMTGYIQNMYGDTTLKAHFNISTKANSFSFGLIRGDKYIPYDQLSAGEKCLYTLALMICITDSNKSPLKLILVDNSLDNLDDIAVENTFTALKNINNIQFIMAGVKACKNAEDVIIRV